MTNEKLLEQFRSFTLKITPMIWRDRRIFSAFNKAGLNNVSGSVALNYLQEKGLIQLEYSREEHTRYSTVGNDSILDAQPLSVALFIFLII